MTDAVSFLVDLIRCPSVTPNDAGTLDRITAWLQPMGFTCVRLPFGEGKDRVDNLFAHRGEGSPHLCFAGLGPRGGGYEGGHCCLFGRIAGYAEGPQRHPQPAVDGG